MTVTSGHVTALRAALKGDVAAFEYMAGRQGSDQEFPILLAAASIAAVRERFPGQSSTADVIQVCQRAARP